MMEKERQEFLDNINKNRKKGEEALLSHGITTDTVLFNEMQVFLFF